MVQFALLLEQILQPRHGIFQLLELRVGLHQLGRTLQASQNHLLHIHGMGEQFRTPVPGRAGRIAQRQHGVFHFVFTERLEHLADRRRTPFGQAG